MELENMKKMWQEMDVRMENQERTTGKLIEDIMRAKYKSRLNKIGYPEYAGFFVCYAASAYLSVNLPKLHDVTMQIFTAFDILLLLLLPIISLKSLRSMQNLDASSKTYTETIIDFAQRKAYFQKLQKLNIALSFFLLITLIPAVASILGKDLHEINHFWSIIFPSGVGLFLLFAFSVLRFYNKVLKSTENMLSENS